MPGNVLFAGIAFLGLVLCEIVAVFLCLLVKVS